MYYTRQRSSWLGTLSQLPVTRRWLKQKRTRTSERHFPFTCMPCQIFSIWCTYSVGCIFSILLWNTWNKLIFNILKCLYLSWFCLVISASRYHFIIYNTLGQWALQLYHPLGEEPSPLFCLNLTQLSSVSLPKPQLILRSFISLLCMRSEGPSLLSINSSDAENPFV